jgi:glutamine synthetase
LLKADEMLLFKYVIHNIAHAYGKTVTFMPKPLVGDNGSGLHCHQSLSLNNKNLFAGDGYAGLSDLALYYTGGIIKHARALCAFTNPITNSYKRLVPGFEAPVTLVYSESNRSAAIRIPYVFSDKEKRIEVRFPDAAANSYLAFSAMLMAGLDGIANKIHPGEAVDENIYDLSPEKAKALPNLCSSLEQALDCLEANNDFLLQGNVFSKEIIKSYIELKREEVARLNGTTHPLEFDMYYSV